MNCVKQSTKKYTTRPSPPFPANQCCDKRKKGNDGRMWVSRADKRGICRWVPAATPAKAKRPAARLEAKPGVRRLVKGALPEEKRLEAAWLKLGTPTDRRIKRLVRQAFNQMQRMGERKLQAKYGSPNDDQPKNYPILGTSKENAPFGEKDAPPGSYPKQFINADTFVQFFIDKLPTYKNVPAGLRDSVRDGSDGAALWHSSMDKRDLAGLVLFYYDEFRPPVLAVRVKKAAARKKTGIPTYNEIAQTLPKTYKPPQLGHDHNVDIHQAKVRKVFGRYAHLMTPAVAKRLKRGHVYPMLTGQAWWSALEEQESVPLRMNYVEGVAVIRPTKEGDGLILKHADIGEYPITTQGALSYLGSGSGADPTYVFLAASGTAKGRLEE